MLRRTSTAATWRKSASEQVSCAFNLFNSRQFVFAEYSRALERIFDDDNAAHSRANELLTEADRFFAPTEASLQPSERRYNSYIWRRLQNDRATRTAENAYEKLERIGYCGYGTNEREHTHRLSAAKAAKRQEQGEEVSRDAQISTLKRKLQPSPRDRFFIEHPPGKMGESRVYESVSERKAQFGERCILTALRE